MSSEYAVPRRPLLHPLAGGRLIGLIRTLSEHGGFSLRALPQVVVMLAGAIARWPFHTFETLRVSHRAASASFKQPPIFIVGHWRSGTTYLHNLMSLDPRLIYPTAADALRPFEFYPSPFGFISRSLLKWSLPTIRPMDNVPLDLDLPQEDELALATMGAPSFFNSFYFPDKLGQIFEREVLLKDESNAKRMRHALRHYLGKLQALHPTRRLLIKNPAHSARIGLLRGLFPGAKFIHIHRHPLTVHQSTCKLYRRMIEVSSLQGDCPNDIEQHTLSAYKQLMGSLLSDLQGLPESDRIEIKYEEFVRNPSVEIGRIYGHFRIADYDGMAQAIEKQASVGAPGSRETVVDAETAKKFAAELNPFTTRLGYEQLPARSGQ